MRKLIAVTTAAALALALSACKKDEAPAAEATETAAAATDTAAAPAADATSEAATDNAGGRDPGDPIPGRNQ